MTLFFQQKTETSISAKTPAFDWKDAPILLSNYSTERKFYMSQRDATDRRELTNHAMLDLIRCNMVLGSVPLNLPNMPNILPAHQRLSSILDQAIIEAVRLDKKLLRGIYRELLDEQPMPVPYITKPLINFGMNIVMFRGKAGLIDTMVRIESNSMIETRAQLSAKILQRVTKINCISHNEPQATDQPH